MASRESIRPGSITECNNYVQIPDGARLPFLLNEGDSELGRGGFGIVTRETIAAGHFLENGTLNRVGKVIARKRFDNKILFDRERVVATFLQNSRLEHKNILVPLAMISSKSESSILMNEADCNLEVFLREDGRMGSAISLKSLLGQVANLAHALNLLHNPIRPDPTIFHLDLKPQNVLVNLSREPDQAGTWMLADFGMSTHFRANMYTDVTGIDHSGPQGLLRLGRTDTYVAPDAKGSACSDVWSLGCILCRVVCRKRYGIEGLRVFDGLRSKDATTDYFYRGTAVNPYVSALLDEFCTSGCEMTEQCGHLLKGVLSIDERKRPGALKLHDSLKRIIGAQEAPSTRPTPPLQLHIVPDILEGTPQRPIQDSTVGIQQANPVFLAIENQSETNASIQLTALFKGSIPSYSSIKDYDEDLTPLCHASKKGYTKIVKFLLEKGAHVDEADKRKNTPLMYACREGHCDTAKFLIDQGADWNLQGADGYSCLHFATEARKINIVEMLVGKQAGATVKLDANLVSSLDRTPLELHLNRHSRDARYELMKQLMSLGANAQVSSSNQHHTTAVQMMLGDNDQQAMEILVTDNNRTWKVSRKEVQRRGGMKSILRRNNRLVE
ncbi:ankyrin repeat-containing domain protein [Aspergillus californicus]